MQSRNGLWSRIYPLIYSKPWPFYMQIHYMWASFWSPYLSNAMRSTCISFQTYCIKTYFRAQFHQLFKGAFLIQKFVQSQNLTRIKAFVWKRRAKNVDEIDTSRTFKYEFISLQTYFIWTYYIWIYFIRTSFIRNFILSKDLLLLCRITFSCPELFWEKICTRKTLSLTKEKEFSGKKTD